MSVKHFLDLAVLQSILELGLNVHLSHDVRPGRPTAHHRLQVRLLRVPLSLRAACEDRIWRLYRLLSNDLGGLAIDRSIVQLLPLVSLVLCSERELLNKTRVALGAA